MRKGWGKRAFEDIATIERGKFSARPRNDPKFFGGSIPFVQTGDVSRAKDYIREYSQTLNESGLAVSRLFPKGTIMMGIAANVGDVAVLNFDAACPDSVVGITPKKDIDSEWLFQALKRMKHTFEGLSTQNAQKNLNLEKLQPVKIMVPPLPEQRKIAAILRTWDEAIEKYNSYLSTIRKKRTLIIQQTLNAKKWPLATLAEISDIIVSNVDKKSVKGQQAVRLCNYMDVFYNRYITGTIPFMEATASDREIATYALKKGDAVFTKDSETPEDIAVCASVEEDIEGLVCGYHLAIARPKSDKILGTYLAEAINSPRVHHRFVRAANGATRFGLTRGDIDDIELPLPPIKEQQKIMAALRQCDHEKELTEQRIKHLQSQKRGLMQKLLSGTWRVQVDEDHNIQTTKLRRNQ